MVLQKTAITTAQNRFESDRGKQQKNSVPDTLKRLCIENWLTCSNTKLQKTNFQCYTITSAYTMQHIHPVQINVKSGQFKPRGLNC